MRRKTLVVATTLTVFLGALCIGTALSQEGRRPGGMGGRFDPERMRQMIAQRIKEALGATDEEWQVLAPKIEKVQTLSRQIGGGMRMFGRRRMGTSGAAPQRELSPVEKAAEELRTAVENESSTPDQIRRKLTALRAAREKVRQELDKAREDLRALLSVRQEAQLVLMGLLD